MPDDNSQVMFVQRTKPTRKMYLGDGVYVAFDGYHLVLTTENGIQIDNVIYLEPIVWESLQEYVNKLRESADESTSL